MISPSFIELEGDLRHKGIGIGDDDEEACEGEVARGADRNMCKWIGSSPLRTARGRGPFSKIA